MNDIFIREHIIRYTECVVLRPEKPYLIPPLSDIKNFLARNMPLRARSTLMMVV